MRSAVAPILVVLSSVLACCQSNPLSDRSKAIPEQVKPVHAFLVAVKNGDMEQLKAAFSARVRGRIEKRGWSEALRQYQILLQRDFGDYKIEEFVLAFEGDSHSGSVAIAHDGKKSPGLRVIKEPDGWKIDER